MEKKLTKEQIARLYNVYDFEEHEEITDAVLVGEHTLIIHYVDTKENCDGTYLPGFDGKEDLDKLDLIMNGIKLERN
ncbi:MAG: hypothetical protein K5765_06970 [Clostridia bacterium]|nr:hypothetical protein [Clostridia bacterium]